MLIAEGEGVHSPASHARDTMHAAVMARELLWEDETDLRMENFVEVSQT